MLRKIEEIVREEMDRAGAQEVLLPIAQPLELWQRSGRDATYGPMMFRLRDRKETGYCLSPTAEEVVTTIVAQEYGSYRDLPVNLYQINWKYRDELRPRFGLLRGREFLMKDAYSFDADADGLRASYQLMFDAYCRVFDRCGFTFRAVEAQSGEMGGSDSREFMAVAAVGEDDFVWCPNCDYAANVEAARRQEDHAWKHTEVPAVDGADAMEEVSTPGMPGIAGVAEHLGVDPSLLLKCIAFEIDGELGLALVPGDREVNEFALAAALAPHAVRLYTDDDFTKHPELPKGYIGPHFPGATVVVADPSVRAAHGWVTGANRVDHHVRNAVLGRDFDVDVWADLVTVVPGDACPHCGQPLAHRPRHRSRPRLPARHEVQRGARRDVHRREGRAAPDGDGLLRHRRVAHPRGCCRGVPRRIRPRLACRARAVRRASHRDPRVAATRRRRSWSAPIVSTRSYRTPGSSVLYDDRDVSPGVKFADADLVGVPVQLVVGAKGVGAGRGRAQGARDGRARRAAARRRRERLHPLRRQ